MVFQKQARKQEQRRDLAANSLGADSFQLKARTEASGLFGVGEGVLAGVGRGRGRRRSRRPRAGGEGVEELLAGFVKGLKLEDFAA